MSHIVHTDRAQPPRLNARVYAILYNSMHSYLLICIWIAGELGADRLTPNHDTLHSFPQDS